MRLRRQEGVSLIEVMVGVAVLGILLSFGAQNFSEWIQNAQLRTAAETFTQGLNLARAEAVRRNTRVRFQLMTTTTNACALAATGPSWVISLDDASGQCASDPSDTVVPRIIQSRNANEGSPNVVVNAGGVSALTFDGSGLASAVASINFTNPAGGTCVTGGGPMRCLRITVSRGGQIRMCDPARPADDPQGC